MKYYNQLGILEQMFTSRHLLTAEEAAKHAPNIMNVIIWNCRGIGRPAIIQSLKHLVKTHRSFLLFMSEIKCSEAAVVSNLIRKLCFDAYEFVPAIEKLGGLLLAWKSFL